MLRHIYLFSGLLVMAIGAVFLVVNPAAADQQGWPLNPPQSGFSPGPAYGTPATYAPFYPPAAVAPATPQTEVRSFYPSAADEEYAYGALSTPFVENQPVRINVSVPANAQITFNGAKTMQTGAIRAFVSPPVAPGRDYFYDVTAKWQQEGREVTRTQHIAVHAGDVVNVMF